jgi:hypothetical protein
MIGTRARTSRRRRPRLVVLAAALACVAPAASAVGTGEAFAAADVSVTVTPPTPGTVSAPVPVAVAVRATLDAQTASTQRPLSRLQIALPDGFTTTLSKIPSCVEPVFAAYGSQACPAATRLGSGTASFVFALPGLKEGGATDEIVLFHGARSAGQSDLYLYVHVSKPIRAQFVVPGTIADRPAPAGPLVSFDLSGFAKPTSSVSVSVTAAALEIAQGLAAGPCDLSGHWTFRARLDYTSGESDSAAANAACGPDTIAPSLRAAARDGTPRTGVRLPIRLSEAAHVTVTLQRRSAHRWKSVRRATFRAPEGATTLRIRRAHGRALPRGRYRARLQATDRAGLTSAARTVALRLR